MPPKNNRWVVVVVYSLSHVPLFVTPWTAAHQSSLSFTISQSLLKLMSIELMMPSNHPILCCPLLHLPSIFPSIRVFSNESALRIRWPKYWSFSFSLSPSNVRHRNVPLWMFFKDCFKSRRWEYLYDPDSSKCQMWSHIPFKKQIMISITYYHEAIIIICQKMKQNRSHHRQTALGRHL